MKKEYKTKNFYFSCFLYTKGIRLIRIDKGDKITHSEFVFEDNPKIEKWNTIYHFGKEEEVEMLVDAQKFINSVKELKEKLYSLLLNKKNRN